MFGKPSANWTATLPQIASAIAAFAAMAMPEAPPEEIAEENASPELAIPELHSVVEGSVTWPCWAVGLGLVATPR